jgi:hypothetical protein
MTDVHKMIPSGRGFVIDPDGYRIEAYSGPAEI